VFADVKLDRRGRRERKGEENGITQAKRMSTKGKNLR
jgi:hypothetical protein